MAAVVVMVGLVLAMAVAFAGFLSERNAARRRAIEARKRQILADAMRTKALLDREAFRAARAMTEAAQRARRR
ncbi:hypothetical protein [Serinicoccus marinus]|uniref:hypothetical protein n=1 Tax=Serinicoccus marinus TaxID=247333 RepID=UPI0024917C8D|nr:hypothetical protein [Serinicoccus marinus]